MHKKVNAFYAHIEERAQYNEGLSQDWEKLVANGEGAGNDVVLIHIEDAYSAYIKHCGCDSYSDAMLPIMVLYKMANDRFKKGRPTRRVMARRLSIMFDEAMQEFWGKPVVNRPINPLVAKRKKKKTKNKD
jgi:hypothetical protein